MDREKQYAVIDIRQDGYPSFANAIKEEFVKQINTMLEPAAKQAVNWFTYQLFERSSEERYSDEFTKILNKALENALTDPKFNISDKRLSSIRQSNEEMYKKMSRTEQGAKNIMGILENVQMSGKPYEIAAINDFIRGLAYPNTHSDNQS